MFFVFVFVFAFGLRYLLIDDLDEIRRNKQVDFNISLHSNPTNVFGLTSMGSLVPGIRPYPDRTIRDFYFVQNFN